MKGKDVRERFLRYFEKHAHKVLPSSSLVPSKDPTLLFTNAGMVQFKGSFLGYEDIGTVRATTSQKCLRVSGKHNDLENVGYTARHHTFFEMLGNFSFGDYFKKDAIFFGWDFLTVDLGLDPTRLYVSVFRDDDEAYEIWKSEMGIPEERIFRFDEEDNFWSMGDTGPCGPCSEILYDQGMDAGCNKPSCQVGCECDRYLEIWNLVFMQFNRDEEGKLTPLPSPSIDTGMGLERITAVAQGVTSNYDTDFFTGLIGKIESLSGLEYGRDGRIDSAMRVIADHARATAFLISDGVLPGNEGRGYVLRRIMRRALRHGKKLGFSEPFLRDVTDTVGEELGGHYGELVSGKEFVRKVVTNEEERFLTTLDGGLKIYEEEAEKISRTGGNVFPGAVAFKLYDTYGFPLDLTQDICRERGLSVDTEEFDTEMEKQKARARTAWKGGEFTPETSLFSELPGEFKETKFTGYGENEGAGKVIALVVGGERVEAAISGESVELVTSSTPFYAEGGGQTGDRGIIRSSGGVVEIVDTCRLGKSIFVHRGAVTGGTVSVNEDVSLEVDREQRSRTEANHTATHILQAGLREILGDHVRQAGSYVGPDKFRFDYTHFDHVGEEIITRLEEFVNGVILEGKEVDWEQVEYDEALSMGAMAFFGEKYDKIVRMVSIGGVSRELCGGTHVRNTRSIGLFVVTEERALSSGVRRIEALTGEAARIYLNTFRMSVQAISRTLHVASEDVEERVNKLSLELKRLSKENEEIRKKALKGELLGGGLTVEDISGRAFAHRIVDEVDVKTMREMMDELKGKVKKGVIFLGSRGGGKSTILVGVTKNLIGDVDAREAVKKISDFIGGKGGGRADLAQAGSSEGEAVEKGLQALREYLTSL